MKQEGGRGKEGKMTKEMRNKTIKERAKGEKTAQKERKPMKKNIFVIFSTFTWKAQGNKYFFQAKRNN